jgi:hypothetical protein
MEDSSSLSDLAVWGHRVSLSHFVKEGPSDGRRREFTKVIRTWTKCDKDQVWPMTSNDYVLTLKSAS